MASAMIKENCSAVFVYRISSPLELGFLMDFFFFTAVLRNLRHHAKYLQEHGFEVKTAQGSSRVRGEVSLLSTGKLLSWCEWYLLASGTKSDPAGGPQWGA